LQVGVEIKATTGTAANHHHKVKETQLLTARTTLKFEKSRVRVSAGNGGRYKIIFANPKLPAGKNLN